MQIYVYVPSEKFSMWRVKYHFPVFPDMSHPSEADQAAEAADGLGGEADYQVLSAQEEEDLASMMSQCDFAISNAEAFAEQLAKDLSVLDGVSHLTHLPMNKMAVI